MAVSTDSEKTWRLLYGEEPQWVKPDCRVYINHIPSCFSETQLKQRLQATYGPVEIEVYARGGYNNGYAWVAFKKEEAVKRAIALNEHGVWGRPVQVDAAAAPTAAESVAAPVKKAESTAESCAAATAPDSSAAAATAAEHEATPAAAATPAAHAQDKPSKLAQQTTTQQQQQQQQQPRNQAAKAMGSGNSSSSSSSSSNSSSSSKGSEKSKHGLTATVEGAEHKLTEAIKETKKEGREEHPEKEAEERRIQEERD
ncbi:hypothetical protein, conserved [Eimeria praecox]|uniref:RRM domain-containing protein n=1 Tax=Eimeria praecox TaxID=51316 RepID=U6GNE1_9EIME|nr:hypothetical protein, conserved [Eimeria praecox]